MHLYLDHVIVAVFDLEQAIKDYTELGFTVTRGSKHSNGATHNALIAFEDSTYIELLAATGDSPVLGYTDWSSLVGDREGLIGYALRANHIDAETSRLQFAGIAVGEIQSGERQRADGLLVQWKTLQIENGFAPFLIEDVTPHELRVPNDLASTTHANQAVGMAGVHIVVKSLENARKHYQKILGLRTENVRYYTNLNLKTGVITLSEAAPLYEEADFEKHVHQSFGEFAETIQNLDPSQDSPTFSSMREHNQKLVETIKATQHYAAKLWAALGNGEKAEALFAIEVIFDRELDADLSLDKTHNVRIMQESGVSKRRQLSLFERMDQVNWSAVQHAYGQAVDTPNLIRALTSGNKKVRDSAYEDLYNSLNHQSSIYPATLTALPFLIELVSVPEVPAKDELLGLIGSCSGFADIVEDKADLPEAQRLAFALERALGQAFVTGMPIYLELLHDSHSKVRSAAATALSNIRSQRQMVEAALLTARQAEKNAQSRAEMIGSLVNLWLSNALSDPPPTLSITQQAMVAEWMRALREPYIVRSRAAFTLLRYGGEEWIPEGMVFVNEAAQPLEKDPTPKNVFKTFFDVGQALLSHPELLLQWLVSQSQSTNETIRSHVPFELSRLAEMRRSFAAKIAPTLITLARDQSVEVRFKAAINLSKFQNTQGVKEVLQEIAEGDPSPPMRERMAQELEKTNNFKLRSPKPLSPELSLAEMTSAIEAALNGEQSIKRSQQLDSILFALGQQGTTAIGAVPALKQLLAKPDKHGWVQLESLRALWRIQPSAAQAILPQMLPYVFFRFATASLFVLFGEIGAAAESTLPLLRDFVQSDFRAGGLPRDFISSEDFLLDEALLATARQAIEQIERGLTQALANDVDKQ